MRNKILYLSAAIVAAFEPCVAGTARPNILIILTDDQGYGDVGFNGCQDIPTPHMDAIANGGIRFTEAYVTASQCAPSRAGLFTGIHQVRFGRNINVDVDNHGIPQSIRVMGEYFKDTGYRTGYAGKWHLGWRVDGCRPLDRGFDWFYGHPTGWVHFPPEGTDRIPGMYHQNQPIKVDEYSTFYFRDRTIEFLRQPSEQPFLFVLSFFAPHAPLQAPEDYLKRFEHLAVQGESGVRCRYTKSTIAHPRQVYAAMVAALDDAIGEVMATLRDLGLEENTLVWFLSDNGGPTGQIAASNAPLRGVKGDVLEGGVRVPFAVQWPGRIAGGQVVETTISSLDILPTSLSASGAPVPDELDGINLLPLMVEGTEPEPRTLFWKFDYPEHHPVFAVRKGDWKLVSEALRVPGTWRWDRERGGRTGLYRISDDIREERDLTAHFPEIRERLAREFAAWADTLPPRVE